MNTGHYPTTHLTDTSSLFFYLIKSSTKKKSATDKIYWIWVSKRKSKWFLSTRSVHVQKSTHSWLAKKRTEPLPTPIIDLPLVFSSFSGQPNEAAFFGSKGGLPFSHGFPNGRCTWTDTEYTARLSCRIQLKDLHSLWRFQWMNEELEVNIRKESI